MTAAILHGNTEVWPLLSAEDTLGHGTHAVVPPRGYQGRDCIQITSDDADLPDNSRWQVVETRPFTTGTIELWVASFPTKKDENAFAGVTFQVHGSNDPAKCDHCEGVYLRMLNSGAKLPKRNHVLQHFASPDMPWNVLRERFPGQHETYADVRSGEWNHLRIEVQRTSLAVWVNQPLWSVRATMKCSLIRAEGQGYIGLFTERFCNSYYSDLRITHASV